MGFTNGHLGFGDKTIARRVRAVRGTPFGSSTLVDNGDGTVSDTNSGLVWQQTSLGEMDWESALNYCESLSLAGYSDWRLPSVNELISLLAYQGNPPLVDQSAIPAIASKHYLSSTTLSYNSAFAWSVSLKEGTVFVRDKSAAAPVLAVRGGSPVAGPEAMPPTPPTDFQSSPTIDMWSTDDTVVISWTAGTDTHSGVAGYSFLWDTFPMTDPDSLVDQTGLTLTGPALPTGSNHYFHIRTIDNSGNASDTVHVGPFKIDTTAPSTEASPISGTLTIPEDVQLTCNDGIGSGCSTVYYTLDGTVPTTSSTVYTSPIPISTSTEIKFFAVDAVGNGETVKTAAYVMDKEPSAGAIQLQESADSTNMATESAIWFNTGEDATVSIPMILQALEVGDVTIQSGGDIVITAPIDMRSISANTTLRLIANGNINVQAAISGGTLALSAGENVIIDAEHLTAATTVSADWQVDIRTSQALTLNRSITAGSTIDIAVTTPDTLLNLAGGTFQTTAGPITLRTDQLNIAGTLITAGSNDIRIQTTDNAQRIHIGNSPDDASHLGLTLSELTSLACSGILAIGHAEHIGGIDIGSIDVDLSDKPYDIHLQTAGSIEGYSGTNGILRIADNRRLTLTSGTGTGQWDRLKISAENIVADNTIGGDIRIANEYEQTVTVHALTTRMGGDIDFVQKATDSETLGGGDVKFITVSTADDGSPAAGEGEIRLKTTSSSLTNPSPVANPAGDLYIIGSVEAPKGGKIIITAENEAHIFLQGTLTVFNHDSDGDGHTDTYSVEDSVVNYADYYANRAPDGSDSSVFDIQLITSWFNDIGFLSEGVINGNDAAGTNLADLIKADSLFMDGWTLGIGDSLNSAPTGFSANPINIDVITLKVTIRKSAEGQIIGDIATVDTYTARPQDFPAGPAGKDFYPPGSTGDPKFDLPNSRLDPHPLTDNPYLLEMMNRGILVVGNFDYNKSAGGFDITPVIFEGYLNTSQGGTLLPNIPITIEGVIITSDIDGKYTLPSYSMYEDTDISVFSDGYYPTYLTFDSSASLTITLDPIVGDINADNRVDINDAIIALRALSDDELMGHVRSDYPVSGADVNGDNRLGIEEAIHALQCTIDPM